VLNERDSGELYYLSDIALETVGYYLLYTTPAARRGSAVATFTDWINCQE
jgi:hypothetical protein